MGLAYVGTWFTIVHPKQRNCPLKRYIRLGHTDSVFRLKTSCVRLPMDSTSTTPQLLDATTLAHSEEGTSIAHSDDFLFPRHRLADTMKVIVSCGSFSPITYLHLRMFGVSLTLAGIVFCHPPLSTGRPLTVLMCQMAKDYIEERGEYELLAGYYSPVGDAYKKEGLAAARHRMRMCELAVDTTSNWLMVDAWESRQPEYMRTALVLDHFDQELNVTGRERKKIKIMLLAGGDLIASFGHPGVWTHEDLHHILGDFGCVIIERTGTDVYGFLLSHDILYYHRKNVVVIKQLIHNDISSTKIRSRTITNVPFPNYFSCLLPKDYSSNGACPSSISFPTL
ncbi:hypothetical protein BC938DRAFT_478169 [Jimgerdemannia flammicorona]|uniref:Cytidyltransferase-like domain-containing protein n=1 Tax=Jimgerdemannia flammicorona TaxID=994334 RepID=A0A433QNB1_9FUNG|nr:hypothetical protein BC938DRAFT_478169 [Jimgerdemannia flammicorona]